MYQFIKVMFENEMNNHLSFEKGSKVSKETNSRKIEKPFIH